MQKYSLYRRTRSRSWSRDRDRRDEMDRDVTDATTKAADALDKEMPGITYRGK